MDDAETKETSLDEQIPVRLRIPTGLASKFAQQMFVSNLGDVVQLSFYEIVPPPIQPNTPEGAAKLKEFGVVSECVARINIPASLYPGFVLAMQQILERDFEAKKEGLDSQTS